MKSLYDLSIQSILKNKINYNNLNLNKFYMYDIILKSLYFKHKEFRKQFNIKLDKINATYDDFSLLFKIIDYMFELEKMILFRKHSIINKEVNFTELYCILNNKLDLYLLNDSEILNKDTINSFVIKYLKKILEDYNQMEGKDQLVKEIKIEKKIFENIFENIFFNLSNKNRIFSNIKKYQKDFIINQLMGISIGTLCYIIAMSLFKNTLY